MHLAAEAFFSRLLLHYLFLLHLFPIRFGFMRS
uniref:Uncharacterized protein n=1 Tax=Setaria italica TaxID=4555 RepID=K3Z128_SETIT